MADQLSTGGSSANYIELAADIVSAFVSNNSVPATDLPALIATVHGALQNVSNPAPAKGEEKPTPAVPVKKSVTADYLISLIDGKSYKSLKRHLIPAPIDQNPWAHSRSPMDMMRQGWSVSLFQASQQ